MYAAPVHAREAGSGVSGGTACVDSGHEGASCQMNRLYKMHADVFVVAMRAMQTRPQPPPHAGTRADDEGHALDP